MRFFKLYSQAACKLECEMLTAYRKCACVPWDYPHIEKDTLVDVCDGWGKNCFENMLLNANKMKISCKHCVPDCNIIRYIHINEANSLCLCVSLHINKG